MFKLGNLLTILLFCFVFSTFAQNNKEVEKNYLEVVEKIQEARDILYTDPYVATELLKSCIELSHKNGEDSLYYLSRELHAASFGFRDQLDSSLLLSEALISDFPKDKYQHIQANLYNHLGTVYGRNNDLDNALEYLLLADSLADFTNSDELKLGIENNIANIHLQNKNIEGALKYYKSGLHLAETKNIDISSVWRFKNNILLCYANLKELDSSRKYFYELMQVPNTPKIDKAESILNLAYSFIQNNNIDSALYYVDLAGDSVQTIHQSTIQRINISHARLMLSKTKDEKYVDILLKELTSSQVPEFSLISLDLHNEIYSYYHERGDIEKAFVYYKKFVTISDSLKERANSAKIKSIEFDLKYQKLQNQVDLQNEHMSKQDARELLLYVIVISLMIFIIIMIAIGLYRKKMISVLASQKEQISEQYTIVEEKNKQLESQNQEIESMLDDLTKSKNYLEKLNKQKDTFLSVLTHQLTNQVQAVMMSSEALYISREEANQKFINKFSEIIYSSSTHLGDMLANLKAWSHTQNNKIQINKEPVELHSTIDLILFNLSQDILKKSLKIELKIQSEIVNADRQTLTSVLKNLIANAVKFSNDLGEIIIESSNTELHTEIKVRDFGIGISAENQSKLFNIETRFSTKGTKGEIGTGLGLLICKELVELNDGSIEIISKENDGTTAIIKFPLQDTDTNSN